MSARSTSFVEEWSAIPLLLHVIRLLKTSYNVEETG